MQQLMQRLVHQPTSADKCVMLPQHHFVGYNPPSKTKNHWASFEKYVAFHLNQGSINTFDELKNIHVLILTDNVQNWFKAIMNVIQNMASLKEKFMKRFNSWR